MKNQIILLVDDEKDICEKIATSFELEDLKCITAYSGNQAIELLKSNPDVCFVISDIRMPDGDGVHLLEFVSANFEKVPVLLLSGFTERSEEELLKLGARKLLLKPTDIDDLISYVKSELSA